MRTLETIVDWHIFCPYCIEEIGVGSFTIPDAMKVERDHIEAEHKKAARG